jgi:flagellar FliJ protein
MATFNFRLQSYLELKKQQEEDVKNKLGKAVMRLEKERKKLFLLEMEKDRYIEEYKDKKRINIKKIREYAEYIKIVAGRIELQIENVKYIQSNVDKIKEELIDAMRDRKIVEKLRERKYELYLKEINRKEQIYVDEIVSYKESIKQGEVNG